MTCTAKLQQTFKEWCCWVEIVVYRGGSFGFLVIWTL